MKGLIVKLPWAELILNGYKDLELRGNNTKIRGTIGIIKSGSKMVYGTVDIVNSIPILTEKEFIKYSNNHMVTCDFENISYKNLFGWVMKNPVKYNDPVVYCHKQGCVIWVNI